MVRFACLQAAALSVTHELNFEDDGSITFEEQMTQLRLNFCATSKVVMAIGASQTSGCSCDIITAGGTL